MSVVANIISAVVKSVVGDKIGNELVNEVIGISIDGVSEKGIDKINDFIKGEKAKIEHILSKDNMKSLNIPEENIDYVVAEIKDLLSEIEITDEVLRQCKYDSMNLSAFLWNEYRECNDYVDCESDIKKGLFAVSEALIKLVHESEDFEKDVLIHISNVVDDANVGLQNISDYMKENFGKLDDNSQIVLNLLITILEQIQKMNLQGNEAKSTTNDDKKFQNNKKQKYIEIWNGKLFLHTNNSEKPITLADAFIMPDYIVHKFIKKIFPTKDTALDKVIEQFIEYDSSSTLLIMGVPGIGKSSITSWIAQKYETDDNCIILRFRDWEPEELEGGVLKAIYNTLECKKEDLNSKVIILDGFDEIKCLDRRDYLLYGFLNDIKDLEKSKIIITSRLSYINWESFYNVIELKPFGINKIKKFYYIITGVELSENMIDTNNLDVLGIPVILYMAIMSDIDLNDNATKPELYNSNFPYLKWDSHLEKSIL